MRYRHAGMTLLEVMLVLAIAASITGLALRQYYVFRADAITREVQQNVGAAFQALGFYYRANCSGEYQYKTTGSCSATLDPRCNPGWQSVPLSLTTLYNTGFLNLQGVSLTSASSPFPPNELVTDYVVQFNQTSQPRYVKTTGPSGTGNPVSVGSIIVTRAQVAVHIRNASQAQTYQYVLGGNCTSSLAGGIVNPCSMGTPGPYVVWEQAPSFSSAQSQSTSWLGLPNAKLFNQMYTTYPINTLVSGFKTSAQYYLCGS